MPSLALVTVTFGHHWELAKYTHPFFHHYAKKIGAHFIVIKTRRYPDVLPQYEKFQMADLLRRYKRICYIDTDAIIRPTTPDLFKVVGEDEFGIVDEGHYPPEAGIWTPEKHRLQYEPYKYLPAKEYNTGVMVFSAIHRKVFENPTILNIPYYDQPWINIQLEKLGIKIHELGREYNYSPLHFLPNSELNSKLHILHYAGQDTWKLPAIKRELGAS